MTHLPDILLALGAVAFVTGCWWAWPPLGPAVVGVILIFVGLAIQRKGGGK